MAACSAGDPVTVDPVTERDPSCFPREVSTGVAPTSPPATDLGRSVGRIRFSASLFSGGNQANLAVTAGAPDDPVATTPNGYLRAFSIDTSDGSIVTGGSSTFELTDPNYGRFGHAHAGVDLVTTQDDPDHAPYRKLGAGDEILVGDPNPSGGAGLDTGVVRWFHNAYKGVSASDEQAWDMYQWVEGGTFQPAGLGTGAGFGSAIAAPEHAFGSQPDWVAVGAPGENAVCLLEVDPTWTTVSLGDDTATPFTDSPSTLLKVTPSSLGLSGSFAEFGASLAAGDLNGDGTPELIIGAPGNAGTAGRVVVLLGTTTFPYVNTGVTDTLQTTLTSSSTQDDYGFALATGPIAIGHPRDLLVIGAPGHDADHGALCWLGYTGATGSLTRESAPLDQVCRLNPFPFTPGDTQRFAEGVAIGDFTYLDTTANPDSDEANVHEVAVSAPGGRPSRIVSDDTSVPLPNGWIWVNYSLSGIEYEDADPGITGTVTVFRSGDTGPLIALPPGAGTSPYSSGHAAHLVAASGGARFGTALATADLQQNEIDDLLIGDPDRGDGEIIVTRSTPDNGFDVGLSGLYDVDDSAGKSLDVRVLEHPISGVSLHVEDFEFRIRDAANDPCTLSSGGIEVFDGDAVTTIHTPYFNIEYPTNDASNPVDFDLDIPPGDVGGITGLTVDGEIFMPTANSFEISFDEPKLNGSDPWPSDDCRVLGSPFTVDSPTPNQCE